MLNFTKAAGQRAEGTPHEEANSVTGLQAPLVFKEAEKGGKGKGWKFGSYFIWYATVTS